MIIILFVWAMEGVTEQKIDLLPFDLATHTLEGEFIN